MQHRNETPSSSSTFFLSDLHLFARRSTAPAQLDEIYRVAERADRLILGGDIFDFRWSTVGGSDATAAEACNWLAQLSERAADCEIHYVLGNHDACPKYRDQLANLAERDQKFTIHPIGFAIGRSYFTHGDRVTERVGHSRQQPLPDVLHSGYDVVSKLKIPRIVSKIAHPDRSTVARLDRFIEDQVLAGEGIGTEPETSAQQGTPSGATEVTSIERVYFGHTHRPIDGLSYQGRLYFNGGAAVEGSEFRILEVEI